MIFIAIKCADSNLIVWLIQIELIGEYCDNYNSVPRASLLPAVTSPLFMWKLRININQ